MGTNPRDNAQHMFYKAFCCGTDMERDIRNATEELRDCRLQGDKVEENGRPPAGDIRTSLPARVWQVNPSGVLKKLRNTGSKPTFDSIYRYRHSHHLSTERLDCPLCGWRQQTGVHRRLMKLKVTMGPKGVNSFPWGFLCIVHTH